MSHQGTCSVDNDAHDQHVQRGGCVHRKNACQSQFGLVHSIFARTAIILTILAVWLLGGTQWVNRRYRLQAAHVLPVEDSAAAEILESHSKRCSFGSAPGRWINKRDEPSTWNLLDSDCAPLRQLLPSLIQSTSSPGCRQPAILLIGDSTDRMVVEGVCAKAGGALEYFANLGDEANTNRALKCNTSAINIAIYPIWGVMPKGPYQENMQETAAVRIPRAFQLFSHHFGQPPQLVVLGSLLWDISAMLHRSSTWIKTRDDLPPELLAEWLQGADIATHHVISAMPRGTPYIWHSQHYPLHKDGVNARWNIGRRAHVTQLNAAVRLTCAKHEDCHLVDIEAMVAQWSDPSTYLLSGDPIHQGPVLALTVLNTYLNILAESAGSAQCTYGQERTTDTAHNHTQGGSNRRMMAAR